MRSKPFDRLRVLLAVGLCGLCGLSAACQGPGDPVDDDDTVVDDDDTVADDDDTTVADDDDTGDDDDATGSMFIDVTEAAGIAGPNRGYGVAVADIDADGWPDLFFTGWDDNRLYRNLGDGTFEDVSVAWGILPLGLMRSTVGATFADFDEDGDPDLFGAVLFGNDLVYRHDGDHFTEISSSIGAGGPDDGPSQQWSFADWDRDGDLDAYVVSGAGGGGPDVDPPQAGPGGTPDGTPDRLYRNDGGTFVDVSSFLPEERRIGVGFVGGWSDLDDDGDEDLYVVNDFGQVVSNQLFRNDGAGAGDDWIFTPMDDSCGCLLRQAGMGLGLADYDRDGRQDLYTSNGALFGATTVGETMLRNLGDMVFVDTSLAIGALAAEPDRISSWGLEYLDIDNNGWPDVFAPFGREFTPEMDMVMRNLGGTFERVPDSGAGTLEWGLGVGVIDYDMDGCLDMAVGYGTARPKLYRNRCTWGNHWVRLELVGTESNSDAVGAVATVAAGGLSQRDEVVAGSTSLASSRWKTLHWGLGQETLVETLEVRWPSGRIDVFDDVAVDRTWRLVEGEGLEEVP